MFVRVVDPPVQLAERGQRGRSHPHDQVLVLEAVVVLVRLVQLPQLAGPRLRAAEAAQRLPQVAVRVAELDLPVGRPRDLGLQQRHRRAERLREQLELVAEQRVGDRAARCDRDALVVVRVRERRTVAGRDGREAPEQLVVVARLHVPPMVLVVVRQPVVQVHLVVEVLLQLEVDRAGAARARGGADQLRAALVARVRLAVRVVVHELVNLCGAWVKKGEGRVLDGRGTLQAPGLGYLRNWTTAAAAHRSV